MDKEAYLCVCVFGYVCVCVCVGGGLEGVCRQNRFRNKAVKISSD